MTKQSFDGQPPDTPRLRAGTQAERQMGFYLHRAFAQDQTVRILNDLRLVDPEQPEPDGKPGVCQIDHLLIHRHGLFIVESKSVFDAVSVRDDGSGGDEWTRRYKGKERGFPSPIQQARRQAAFLRNVLQRHREELLGLVPRGLRSIAKVVVGTEQRGFLCMPIQLLVAISDQGKIRRVGGWTAPEEPFQTFVTKADLVPEKIREEIRKHKKGSGLLGEPRGDYGLWSMSLEETNRVAEFLLRKHTPREEGASSTVRAEQPAALGSHASWASCSACGGVRLTAYWGKRAYMWKCNGCGERTPMPVACGVCGAVGSDGEVVRIRKRGAKYYRCCECCEIEECIWIER
ncbi:MAG: NERD domain-containing protein [Phycisphaerales bacterium]|nr:NERD domain-containing protein [Phycisphaerales bacterium]